MDGNSGDTKSHDPHASLCSNSNASASIDGFMSLGHTCNSKFKNNQKQAKSTCSNGNSVGSLKRYGLRTRSKSFFGHQGHKKDTSSSGNNGTSSISTTIDGSKSHLYPRSASVVPMVTGGGRSGSVSIEPVYVNCSNTSTTGNIHNYLFSISGHSSMAPMTGGNFNCANGCSFINACHHLGQHPAHQQGINYNGTSGEQGINSMIPSNNGHVNFPDSNFIMAKLAHTYSRRNSQLNCPTRTPLATNGQISSSSNCGKLMSGPFSKSAIDLRQESLNSSCNNSVSTSGLQTGLSHQSVNVSQGNLTSVQANSAGGSNASGNVVRRTAASVKRFLLQQTTSLPPSNFNSNVCGPSEVGKNVLESSECIYGNIGAFGGPNCGSNNLVNSGTPTPIGDVNNLFIQQVSSPQLELTCSSLYSTFSRSLSHLSSAKSVSTCVLEALSQKLMAETIDLTEDPYSDSSGFCGIPPALVQRYADELAMDLYEIAESLDHLRLEALAVKGRRGVS